MIPPLTNVLVKIFAKGFFRVNSGLLLFLFVIIISYCFFMETVGDIKLISAEQLTFYHFIIVINFISSPVMTLVISLVWLIYTIKSWRYVIAQIFIAENQFLFYSSTSMNKLSQFKSWFYVQLVIFIPVLSYWLFAFIFGIAFHHYILPGIILLYIFILTSISALLYLFFANRLIDGNKKFLLLQWSHRWKKPFSLLFIYYMFDKMKFTYVITKTISLLIIIGLFNSINNTHSDFRLSGIILLSIVTAHSYLIYQEHRFVETRLSIARNLPIYRIRLFINYSLLYLIILLPECIWLVTSFNLIIAIGLLLFGISVALLFRSLLFMIGLRMSMYLRRVFTLYILIFMLIMFQLLWILIPVILLISFTAFYLNYYNQQTELKS